MEKQVLITILVASFVIPFYAARAKTLRGSVVRAVVATAIASAAWLVAVMYFYPTTMRFSN